MRYLWCVVFVACEHASLFKTGEPSHGSGPIVARVDGNGVSASEMRERALELEPRFDSLDAAQQQDTVDQVLRLEVLYRAALKRGLLDDKDVRAALRRLLVQRLLQDDLDARMKPSDIADEELRAHYENHRADYNQPARVRYQWFIGASKDDAAKAAPLLASGTGRDLTDNKASGLGFDDASFYTSEELHERLGEAADALWDAKELGRPTPIIESEIGWVVCKLTGRKSEVSRPFEQVAETIRQRLYRERRTVLFEDLVKQHREALGVWVDADVLRSLH